MSFGQNHRGAADRSRQEKRMSYCAVTGKRAGTSPPHTPRTVVIGSLRESYQGREPMCRKGGSGLAVCTECMYLNLMQMLAQETGSDESFLEDVLRN